MAGYDNGELASIDLRSGKQTILLRTGGALRHLVGDGRRLYASDMGTASIYVVDLASSRAQRLTTVDDHPNTIDLSPDGRVLYVSCRGRNNPKSYYIPGPEWGSVVVLDARTGRPLDAVVAGNQTTGLDVSEDGGLLAISDFLDNRIRDLHRPAVPAARQWERRLLVPAPRQAAQVGPRPRRQRACRSSGTSDRADDVRRRRPHAVPGVTAQLIGRLGRRLRELRRARDWRSMPTARSCW